MALTVYTPQPKKLLDLIKKAIDEKKIDTWEYDKNGDFTHVPEQWKKEAWLRPQVLSGALLLGLLGRKGKSMSKMVYGVYHGRFIEMLLSHFDDEFSTVTATAQIQTGVDYI